jgi:hypothetical protein
MVAKLMKFTAPQGYMRGAQLAPTSAITNALRAPSQRSPPGSRDVSGDPENERLYKLRHSVAIGLFNQHLVERRRLIAR